jgi:Tfp pilus assembly PilM family ATPase
VFNNHVGINLTDTKLQMVEINYRNDSFFLENVDQIFHAERFIPEMKEENFLNILQLAFNKINKKKSLVSKDISFSLPNNFFKIFEIPYDDSLVKKDLLDHFKWELSILFPQLKPEDYLLQHIEVDKCSVRSEKRAIVFAIDKFYVTVLNKFCDQNGLHLKFVDNVHLASNAFLYLEKPLIDNEISLSIYIDQSYSSVSAIEGVFPFYFKVINHSFTNFFEELTATIQKLDEFNLSLNDFKRVLLYGQDITEEFENKLKNLFGLPLKKVNPFERLKVEESIISNPLYKIKFNSFTAATGVAIRIT